MDTIFIENLKLQGKHGVYAHERKVEQEFLVDISVQTNMESAIKSGKLAQTLDYDALRTIAEEVVAAKAEYLIERLAARIAERVLKFPQAQLVSVTIRKTEVWPNGTPGVTITRSK